MELSIPGTILALALCLTVSFSLSGMEAGLFALSRLRIRLMARKGDRRALRLSRFLEAPEGFLWTILVGNTLAAMGAVGVMVVWLHRVAGDRPVWWLVGLAAWGYLLFVGCDLLPKMVFRTYPNRLCLWLAGPVRLLHLCLMPVVGPLRWFSRGLLGVTRGGMYTGRLFGNRDEMRQVMQESAQALTSDERGMIARVLDLQNLTVGRIAIPMEKAESVALETPMREALEKCRVSGVSRLPVWQAAADGRRVAGVLSVRPILYGTAMDPNRPAGDYVKPALYLEEDLPLETALRRMQRTGERLGIVLDRNRREAGIVSLQDILRVIFGEVSL